MKRINFIVVVHNSCLWQLQCQLRFHLQNFTKFASKIFVTFCHHLYMELESFSLEIQAKTKLNTRLQNICNINLHFPLRLLFSRHLLHYSISSVQYSYCIVKSIIVFQVYYKIWVLYSCNMSSPYLLDANLFHLFSLLEPHVYFSKLVLCLRI